METETNAKNGVMEHLGTLELVNVVGLALCGKNETDLENVSQHVCHAGTLYDQTCDVSTIEWCEYDMVSVLLLMVNISRWPES